MLAGVQIQWGSKLLGYYSPYLYIKPIEGFK
jgi:hypothetical protein